MTVRYRAITLSGEAGSGKSTIARELAALMPGWRRVNTGQRFRDFSTLQGRSIQDVSRLPDEIHIEFDRSQQQTLRQEDEIIVEGRLAGWLARELPDVFRVYCDAPFDVRVERLVNRDGRNREQTESDVRQRDSLDLEKYRRVYGIEDYRDRRFYQLVLQTEDRTPRELAAVILEELKAAEARLGGQSETD